MKDWEELRDIFEAAWPLSGVQRERLLDERCRENQRMREELNKLLQAYDEESRVSDGGRRFGAWETSELVGRGGMAEVYLAQRADGQHQQRAAVKVMARHLVSWDYMDRFRRERQILANLEHPNIARLFDGGVSAAGEPYLVMEYVDGTHLDDYCAGKKLPLPERLRLFLCLCSAVESAHRSLVLHRDIKPSNVLVTADGSLKLVDFGTARRMDGSNLETMAPLTPSFASPEQLRGQPVSTLSDVYGLGMTLYKVVSGTLPFGKGSKNAYQTVQDALERLAPPPSAAEGLAEEQRHSLRGDIDNIVLKAIDPNPNRRYGSAEAFAADVRRFLEKRPVEARPKTLFYRVERFVARNRLGVGLAAVLALTLIAAAAALTMQVRQTKQEAERSKRLANFLAHVMGLGYDMSSGPFRAEGRNAYVVDAILYAADHLSAEMADQPQLEARMRADIGHALAELAYPKEAESNLTRALQVVDRKQEPVLAAEIKGYLARNAFLSGDLARSEQLFSEALNEIKTAGKTVPPAVESLLLLNAAAVPMTRIGVTAEVNDMVNRSLELARKVGENSPVYALALINHGVLLEGSGKQAEGEREMRQGLAIDGALKPRPLEWCIGTAVLGMHRAGSGDLAEGRRLLQEASPCMERTLGRSSQPYLSVRLAEIEIALEKNNVPQTIARLKAWEADVTRALPKARHLVAEGMLTRGSIQCAVSSQRAEGLQALQQVVAIRREAFGFESPETKSAETMMQRCATAAQ